MRGLLIGTSGQGVMKPQTPLVRKTPRIVLLEDGKVFSQLFEDIIHGWFDNIDLVKFENGAEAWKELERTKPDLLILDWVNPGLTGHELLKLLALDQAKFPVLLTSEFFEKHLQLFSDQGWKLGFLPKPFEIKEFWAALNELVGPSDYPEIQALVKTQVERRL